MKDDENTNEKIMFTMILPIILTPELINQIINTSAIIIIGILGSYIVLSFLNFKF